MMRDKLTMTEFRLYDAIRQFYRDGGQPERAKELVEIADAKRKGRCDYANKAISRLPPKPAASATETRGAGGHARLADKKAMPVVPPAPRGPSPTAKTAARKVANKTANSIWERTIGGTVTVGGSTRHHWETMKRKGLAMHHISHRMLTEIEWPDEVTPLEKVASKKQVEEIIKSGYDAIAAECK